MIELYVAVSQNSLTLFLFCSMVLCPFSFFFFFLRFYFYFIFRQREREGEKEREKHQCTREIHQSVASRMPLTGCLACNPGMCPDWELNQQPVGFQPGTQSTEPHQPGLFSFLKLASFCSFSFSFQVPQAKLIQEMYAL